MYFFRIRSLESHGPNMSATEETKLILRRTKSTTRVEEIRQLEEKRRNRRADKPIHKPCDSLFSWSSGFNDFGGFVNWGFLLLLLGGVRLFLENFIKYGNRIDPVQWLNVLLGDSYTAIPPSIILLAYSNLHVLMSLLIEKGLASGYLNITQGAIAQVVNLFTLILTPIAALTTWDTNTFSLIGATTVCLSYSVLFLKLWSYAQVNGWCRNTQKPNRKRRVSQSSSQTNSNGDLNGNRMVEDEAEGVPDVEYPENLYVADIYFFVMVPSLCYELNFPRTERIRKRFLLKRILEFVFGLQLVIALIQQWIIPTVKNSIIPFSNMDVVKVQERLLKLAIPNHLIWLIWFYLFFHSFMNILGEVLRFADREFYLDWWNSPDIDTFWRTWNSPVHRWAVRHLYIPVIKNTGSKFVATSTVFFFSAFFHEYLVSVPLRTFKVWAFCGMMAQLPLATLCKVIVGRNGERPRWGNVVVWASLILGQPLCIMMYYHDYVITHFGTQWLESFSKL
ncbi:unnamed protein product [Allacma fusca]|uniref:O-acyltransferase n=1 Tax=Allacma fusca TaxID=39272 RepID=A0A8J2L0G0_9HEXA|nr:unnamed protein product [Allacma fusca]